MRKRDIIFYKIVSLYTWLVAYWSYLLLQTDTGYFNVTLFFLALESVGVLVLHQGYEMWKPDNDNEED